jgi:hypothetical protein
LRHWKTKSAGLETVKMCALDRLKLWENIRLLCRRPDGNSSIRGGELSLTVHVRFVFGRMAQVGVVEIPQMLLFSPSSIITPLLLHFIANLEVSHRTSH